MIQRLIEAFEDLHPPTDQQLPPATLRLSLDGDCPIDQVITVDGGHQAVPNAVRPERQVGFIQIAAQMVRLETIEYLRAHPMADPREVQHLLGRHTHHTLAALPLAGVHVQGLSVKQSVRDAIHRFIDYYDLYDALSYLVYREWLADVEVTPTMDCLGCGALIDLPRRSRRFRCPDCGEEHRLSDYLGLSDQDSEDRARGETVSNFRSALEVLVLFSFIVKFRSHVDVMKRTLFILDGPLLLRAQLSRLVEPIRDLMAHQRDSDAPLYLVGAEKSGEFRNFADSLSSALSEMGDCFVPDARFVVEEINGRSFEAQTYRNRVNYGAKVVARIGPDHVLALNVPTGEFQLRPSPEDLIGLGPILQALSRLVSYRYDNALIPVVLANTAASISNQPSGSILAQFVNRILRGDA